MNVAKLKKLKAWILAEPRRYNQNTFITTSKCSPYIHEQKPPCGTVVCLAGAACLMEGYDNVPGTSQFIDKNGRPLDASYLAAKILGLTPWGHKLFAMNGIGWSQKARIRYLDSATVKGRADAAAMELDRLIKSELNSKKSRSKSKSKR